MPHNADELLTRIHDYVARLIRDPTLIQRNRSEFQAVVAAWNALRQMLPGVAKIGAGEFEKYLLGLVAMEAGDKMAFAVKWLQARPAMSHPSPGVAKNLGSAPMAHLDVQRNVNREVKTATELAQYQRDMAKYNRMFEMYSKIMANSHEMKKALIGNLPR